MSAALPAADAVSTGTHRSADFSTDLVAFNTSLTSFPLVDDDEWVIVAHPNQKTNGQCEGEAEKHSSTKEDTCQKNWSVAGCVRINVGFAKCKFEFKKEKCDGNVVKTITVHKGDEVKHEAVPDVHAVSAHCESD